MHFGSWLELTQQRKRISVHIGLCVRMMLPCYVEKPDVWEMNNVIRRYDDMIIL